MEYPFLRERKLNPSLTQWYIYFSSDLIQIKVIAQTLGGVVCSDFGEVLF